MRNILVPTDFNVSSFDCFPNICKQLDLEEISFVFVHVFKLSDSITDLLMLSRRSRDFEQISDDFFAGATAIKKAYPQIKSIKIEFLYGATLNMFRDFLEVHDIDTVLEPACCFLGKIHKASIDPLVLIQKSGLPVLTLRKDVKLQKSAVPATVEQELMEA
ncbi:hypothetical protein [Pedobacter duraquae]|uniref:Universal stress protein family protein n=1 Tax=Pedobacter duraquae TaxID=425511 RepID=A0A4V3C3S4_9SPHI|nr:hypothetical protein [Pedobacter duraquae]TDO23188.1 hypothetical protein CLV32_2175 [Pedobacter duraquae]